MVMQDFIVAFIDFIVAFIVVQYKSASNKIEYDNTKMHKERFHFMNNEESCWTNMLKIRDLQGNNNLLFLAYLACVA